MLSLPSKMNKASNSTLGGARFFQTILTWGCIDMDEAAFQTTCKEKDLTENVPDGSNFNKNSSSRPSTKLCWLMRCRRSCTMSCSQTKRFLLQAKLQCHIFFCHCLLNFPVGMRLKKAWNILILDCHHQSTIWVELCIVTTAHLFP